MHYPLTYYFENRALTISTTFAICNLKLVFDVALSGLVVVAVEVAGYVVGRITFGAVIVNATSLESDTGAFSPEAFFTVIL